MKHYCIVSVAAISLSLLSSCAYLQGRHDDQNAMITEKHKSSAKSESANLNAEAPAPIVNRSPNPSAAASKMIAPITQ